MNNTYLNVNDFIDAHISDEKLKSELLDKKDGIEYIIIKHDCIIISLMHGYSIDSGDTTLVFENTITAQQMRHVIETIELSPYFKAFPEELIKTRR